MLKSFGNDLKLLRESKGITLTEIASQTRINPKFFNYIEAGKFDFQPDIYVRAFLRAYASALDMNEKLILNEYEKAKAGFYQTKNILKEEHIAPPKAAEEISEEEIIEVTNTVQNKTEIPKTASVYKPSYKSDPDEEEFSNKSWTQKILLGLLIIVVIAGVIYLIDYLNKSSEDKSGNVKPKSFSEMSSDYENKIKGKTDDTTKTEDTTQTAALGPLKLTVVASKDARIKVYIDEKSPIEEEISAKDSLTIFAKTQFRFSATANASIDLYLNGKYLRKPSSLTGTSIKNLIINKDGIVQ